jgi:hypothetical protein
MGSSIWRTPHTTQERRNSWVDLEDVEDVILPANLIRSKRNIHNLPHSWDDIPKTMGDNKCWKRYRKTRWKQVA